jgi:hypothetical protein
MRDPITPIAPNLDDERKTAFQPSKTPSETACSAHALLVRDLGWTEGDAADTYRRLRPFEEDWDAPGMDAYDEL